MFLGGSNGDPVFTLFCLVVFTGVDASELEPSLTKESTERDLRIPEADVELPSIAVGPERFRGLGNPMCVNEIFFVNLITDEISMV